MAEGTGMGARCPCGARLRLRSEYGFLRDAIRCPDCAGRAPGLRRCPRCGNAVFDAHAPISGPGIAAIAIGIFLVLRAVAIRSSVVRGWFVAAFFVVLGLFLRRRIRVCRCCGYRCAPHDRCARRAVYHAP